MKSCASACWARSRSLRGRSARCSRCWCTRTARSYSPRRRNRLPSAKCRSDVSGSCCTASMKASIALSCCSFSSRLRPLKYALGESRCSRRHCRRSRREAIQPSAKATGRPSSSHWKSKSIARREVGAGLERHRGRRRGRLGHHVGGQEATRDTPVPPPGGHHREHPERAAEAKGPEHDEHHRGAPFLAEEPLDARVVLVVQREREQGEKNEGSNEPHEEPHRAILGALHVPVCGVCSAGTSSTTGTCASTDSRSALPGLK